MKNIKRKQLTKCGWSDFRTSKRNMPTISLRVLLRRFFTSMLAPGHLDFPGSHCIICSLVHSESPAAKGKSISRCGYLFSTSVAMIQLYGTFVHSSSVFPNISSFCVNSIKLISNNCRIEQEYRRIASIPASQNIHNYIYSAPYQRASILTLS